MSREEKQILNLVEASKAGSKESYRELLSKINGEIVTLISFVYSNEETIHKLNKYVVSKMYNSINEFNSQEEDVHLWIARFTTLAVYEVYCKQNSTTFNELGEREYEFNSIEEDSDFAICAAQCNQIFIDKEKFNVIVPKLSGLTKLERLLYQMYAYESYTIDEIEELLNIDSAYIISALCNIRKTVMDYGLECGIVKLKEEQVEDVEELQEEGEQEIQSKENMKKKKKISKRDFEEKFIFAYIPDKILSIAVIGIVILIVILTLVVVMNIGKTGNSKNQETTYLETVPGASFEKSTESGKQKETQSKKSENEGWPTKNETEAPIEETTGDESSIGETDEESTDNTETSDNSSSLADEEQTTESSSESEPVSEDSSEPQTPESSEQPETSGEAESEPVGGDETQPSQEQNSSDSETTV